ncbi:hypothetical protein SEVIR_8G196600v4 [Setaria viridis]|uniref:NB-ARC domain-containing protein n=2 Tax=Setaria viridis TaxID=4556 RepID=A0A4U6TVF9_SETVI|nr:disease resistance protein PIK6-NP-like [Setaria viridis]XP_034569335.1 disease resistance protein PIK6-NP-like [Setaria viridis]TKW01707.1 hypothetical protein SEVIR_8G196600v2 [Setaria viridis]
MAELAIGISKTAVQLLADKVKSAIKEEAKQWQILQQNLVFITGEFEMMQSFLNSADGDRVKNHVVRTWVRQVRDLSNDVEDCIEFVLHLDTKRSWWLRLLPSCSCSSTEGSELPLDLAVTQIEQLKIRVQDVSQRNLRYRFGDSCSDSLTQQQFVSASAIGAPGFDDIHIEAKDTAASCRGAVDLTKLVTEGSNDLRVISLWGTGDDLGTMSIIRNMYDDPTIYRNFRCRAWVKVIHPVNPPELIRSLVVQFYANSCEEQGSTVSIDSQPWLCRLNLKKKRDALSWTETSAGDLVEEFVRQVNTNRYLIILEDLSTVVQWDAIRPYLRDRKNGSCIVVSTRHHEIASLCTGKPYLLSELQRFSANQAIRVFFNAGFKDAEGGAGVTIVQEPLTAELWLSDNRLVGRDSEVDKLSSLIMIKDRPYTDKPHVVSVWGIPGSGRTAVVTNACYRCYAEPGFYWYRMIIMSQPYKYNLMGFCRCLLSGFSESLEVDDLIERCRELLHKYRCLVVIDEMQSKEFWDLIDAENLISSKSKSCIVVITTEESIAIHCAGAAGLVCSIRCLQPMAAFDLLQQEFRTQASQNDGNSSEQPFPSKRNSFEEFAYNYLFELDREDEASFNYFFGPDREDEHTFQNNEDHTFQNNGNALEEQAFQNQENTIEEQAFQNNGNSSGKQAFQNGNTFEEQELQSNNGSSSCTTGNTVKEQPFQNNGNSVRDQAFHNDRDLFEEQTLWNNGNLSLEHAFWSLFETKKQEEHAFENKGTTSEEQAFQNSENLFEGQAFKNSENLVEEETFQNSEDISDELPFENNRNLLQEVDQSENNKNRCVSLSPDDPNVKAILSRSGGFPQVIVALGRYLAKQNLSNAATREWQCQHLIGNFMQELQTNPDFYCLRSLLAWIHFYFRSSPSLMRCMLYLLVFPREQTFRRGRLVRRWIAEGYAKGTESDSLDEFAGELFDKLTSQSVMQQVTPTNMGTRYEVNGFFHEYMISRPVEEKILFPLEVSVLQEGYRRLTTQGVGQHLSIWSSWVGNRVVFDNLDLSRLRSLTVFGWWEAFLVSDKMKVLRVLDLEDAGDGVTNDDVEKIGKVLLRLKFLSLRGCKNITRVPDSLGGLRQLQTLDIRQTLVATLPVSITKLEKLQYLGAGTTSVPLGDHTSNPSPEATSATADPSLSTSGPCALTLKSLFHVPKSWILRYQQLPDSRNGGVVVPGRIGQMTALHTLGVIDVSVASGRATLKELKNLTQLRKLGVSGVNSENCQELCSAISCHANLESFSVWFDKGVNRAGCLDTISQHPVKLQSLKLYGLVDSNLPTWINLLTNLGKLNLQMTTIPQDEVEALGNLPKLRTLCLHFKEFQCGKLDFCTGFPALQLLQVACNSRSQAVTFHAGAMHELEVMNLPCHNVPSSLRFYGLEKLRKLKEISLSGSYDEAMKQQLRSQLAAHPREMKPFLKVEPRSS